MESGPRATVVVPTHNRPAALARCLAALRVQTVPVEVIVVHDGDACAEQVDAICRDAGALCLRKPRGGVASARNKGLALATCDVVLLTDDDCEPAADWAELMCAAFAAGAAVVAGGVVNATPRDPFATATQEIHYHLMEAPGSAFATGNNVGFRRAVFAAVPFDESYAGAGEDRDWCLRVAAAGFELRREPAARVLHWQDLPPAAFVRKHVEYGRSSAYFRARTGARLQRGGWYAGVLRRGFRRGARTGLLVGVAQVASAYGALSETLRPRAKPAAQAAVAPETPSTPAR